MPTKPTTAAIGPKQAARAFHAVRFANDNGQALNLHVTINFRILGIVPDEAGELFREIWARVSRWYAYQRSKGRAFGSFDAYAVHEHPEGGARNVHWVMRVPDGARAEVERVICERVGKLTSLDCLGRAIHFQDVGAAGTLAKYTLKGIDPAYAAHFHMRAVPQGFISGRRITISRSIGFAARQRAGWKRRRAS
ncbi:hypothetical protein [Croceibacterium mercuriale]|uniref:hypothetical protein n=1 Tax=Croceibacterium mercuriale TaxID=1572751 RepID=UPI001269CB2D|nr:hypothetical protein [Croceibacterium mercuriale]